MQRFIYLFWRRSPWLLVISSQQVWSAPVGLEVRSRRFEKARSSPFIREDWKLIRREWQVTLSITYLSIYYYWLAFKPNCFHNFTIMFYVNNLIKKQRYFRTSKIMFEVFIILHYVYHERSGFSKTSQENMYTLNKLMF